MKEAQFKRNKKCEKIVSFTEKLSTEGTVQLVQLQNSYLLTLRLTLFKIPVPGCCVCRAARWTSLSHLEVPTSLLRPVVPMQHCLTAPTWNSLLRFDQIKCGPVCWILSLIGVRWQAMWNSVLRFDQIKCEPVCGIFSLLGVRWEAGIGPGAVLNQFGQFKPFILYLQFKPAYFIPAFTHGGGSSKLHNLDPQTGRLLYLGPSVICLFNSESSSVTIC